MIDNGSAFLVSPRNFDRVMAIDRETKETRWTLGEEDNYDILHEQHNPVLLQRDPLTVLVADSENDRIVEYRRTDSGGGSSSGRIRLGFAGPGMPIVSPTGTPSSPTRRTTASSRSHRVERWSGSSKSNGARAIRSAWSMATSPLDRR
ncbi:hypothetical protein ACFQL0_07375 [Haloplanus litoreus]|uniref:hypothetical protein n=1 Tax=Haloplanus litoreus TaxID=767515 RepID=UPI003621D4F0